MSEFIELWEPYSKILPYRVIQLVRLDTIVQVEILERKEEEKGEESRYNEALVILEDGRELIVDRDCGGLITLHKMAQKSVSPYENA